MIHCRTIAFLVTAIATAHPTTEALQALMEQGYSEMYNLRFNDAHRTFERYESMRPTDPLGPVSDAAACLFSEFDRLHILQSEFLLSDESYLSAEKHQPDIETKTRFENDLKKSQQLATLEMQQPEDRHQVADM